MFAKMSSDEFYLIFYREYLSDAINEEFHHPYFTVQKRAEAKFETENRITYHRFIEITQRTVYQLEMPVIEISDIEINSMNNVLEVGTFTELRYGMQMIRAHLKYGFRISIDGGMKGSMVNFHSFKD